MQTRLPPWIPRGRERSPPISRQWSSGTPSCLPSFPVGPVGGSPRKWVSQPLPGGRKPRGGLLWWGRRGTVTDRRRSNAISSNLLAP